MGSKPRLNSVIVAALCYFIATIFLILILIGNIGIRPVLTDIYFFRLDVSEVIPVRIPNAVLLNSVARSLGLHDFYQIGLWNFCQGYLDEGFTECSKPEALWWFNPIEILRDQLLSGASIALPSEVNTVLSILRIGQQVMFGFFLAGVCLTFVLIFASPIALRSRWWSLPLAIFAFLDAVLVSVASIIGTAMSLGAKYALTAQSELNLRADIGVRMFAFMWISTICIIVAFFFHAIMGCCCRVNRSATTTSTTTTAEGATTEGVTTEGVTAEGATPAVEEKKSRGSGSRKMPRLPDFMRRRRAPVMTTTTES